MRVFKRVCAMAMSLAVTIFMVSHAFADEVVGAPRAWEMGMQPAFGPLKVREIELHNLVLVIITVITLFVAGLLAWVMCPLQRRRNPVPSQTATTRSWRSPGR